MYNTTIAKEISHDSFQLDNTIWVGHFGATLWAPVQDKIAVIDTFETHNEYLSKCKTKKYLRISWAEYISYGICGPFRATIWAPIQDKIDIFGVLVISIM